MKRILFVAATLAVLCALFSSTASALTLQDVGAMKQAGLADSLIAERIVFSCQVFHLEANEIAQLKDAGVSDALIGVMRRSETDLIADSYSISVGSYQNNWPHVWGYPDAFESEDASNSDYSSAEGSDVPANSGYGYGYGAYNGNYSSGYYYPHDHHGYHGAHGARGNCDYRGGGRSGGGGHHASGGYHGGSRSGGSGGGAGHGGGYSSGSVAARR